MIGLDDGLSPTNIFGPFYSEHVVGEDGAKDELFLGHLWPFYTCALYNKSLRLKHVEKGSLRSHHTHTDTRKAETVFPFFLGGGYIYIREALCGSTAKGCEIEQWPYISLDWTSG